MIYVSTHKGKRHERSEDSVVVGANVICELSCELLIPDYGFIGVADGVGGSCGGREASQFLANALSEYDSSFYEDAKSFLNRVNCDLIEAAKQNSKYAGMATTFTGILRIKEEYKLIHIGNTRAYVKQGQYLKQITSDHTVYNWLLSSGQEAAAKSCRKNEITNCFGGGDHSLLSKLYVNDCKPFSLIIFTSDGIHDYVDLDMMENIICGEGSYSEKCEELLSAAIAAGSEDDMTVVIINNMKI